MKKAMIDYMQNIKNDELYTPEYAIKPLLKYINEYNIIDASDEDGCFKLKKPIIWECTDFGNSNITKVFENAGYDVISTNKEDFDFLNDEAIFDFDMIITNPPYSLKDEFIKKCYEYNKPFALLLPITSLEGIERGKMFRENGIELLVFDRRCNFIYDNAKKSNWFNTSWFCWNILPKQLIFEELKKDE